MVIIALFQQMVLFFKVNKVSVMYCTVQFPLKVSGRHGQFFCFCYTLKTCLRSKDDETTDQKVLLSPCNSMN